MSIRPFIYIAVIAWLYVMLLFADLFHRIP